MAKKQAQAQNQNKSNGSGKKGQQAQKSAKPPKEPKVKGKKPDFTARPKFDPAARDSTNRRLKDSEPWYSNLVEGVLGEYTYGVRGDMPWLRTCSVEMMEGQGEPFVAIWNDEHDVFVPRLWLFRDEVLCNFVKGWKRGEQIQLLRDLKMAMASEVDVSKKKYQAAKLQAHEPTLIEMAVPVKTAKPTQQVDEKLTPRLNSFNLAKSASLTLAILRMRVYQEGVAGLYHMELEQQKRVYFLREKMGGAQKVTFVGADLDDLLIQIEDTHPQGVTVDVAEVVNGPRHPLNTVDVADMRNARRHVIAWLQNNFNLGQQAESDTASQGVSYTA